MRYYWWPLQVILTFVSAFFCFFGIDLLRAAYSLNNPFNFIMTFFAASLMILISLTLMAGFIVKMIRVYRKIENKKAENK
ncbi:MAG: hypothetical protein U9N77_06335 [Thermodesulfobacteriota bacterium]|nr:hypothetical protein [Thermodesulfobacteriota bacterium]